MKKGIKKILSVFAAVAVIGSCSMGPLSDAVFTSDNTIVSAACAHTTYSASCHHYYTQRKYEHGNWYQRSVHSVTCSKCGMTISISYGPWQRMW